MSTCANCKEEMGDSYRCDYCESRVCEFCIKHLQAEDEGLDICESCIEG
jgi:hypothetical protein